MSSLFSVVAIGMLGFGLGAVAGRDLRRMAAGLAGPGNRFAIPWGLGKRLALFLLALGLAARHGSGGVLLASAGYLGGFAVLAFRGRIALGR